MSYFLYQACLICSSLSTDFQFVTAADYMVLVL